MLTSLSGDALAQNAQAPGAPAGEVAGGVVAPRADEAGGPVAPRHELEHAAPSAGAAPGHASAPAPGEGHAASGGHHHVPTFGDVNWVYGILGASDVEEPTLLFRPKSMQPPVLASLINASIVFFILIYFGRKPLRASLVARRTSLLRGIEEASQVRASAERRMQELDDRLAHIDDRLAEIRKEMREAADEERGRILNEARERSERMAKEAHRLVAAELDVARTELKHEIVREAVVAARQQLRSALTATDETRLAEEHLSELDRALGSGAPVTKSIGGRA